MAGKPILRLVFANTVFHRIAKLQLFYAEYTESVRHSFVSRFYHWPIMVGPGE